MPYATTVKMVCAACNDGWLSQLEGVAKPVIASLILGEDRRLPVNDQALIAARTCKTALMSLLMSSDEARARGYGSPLSEYLALYSQRDLIVDGHQDLPGAAGKSAPWPSQTVIGFASRSAAGQLRTLNRHSGTARV
jgi:hypothetical protein